MDENFNNKLNSLPDKTGVYIFKDVKEQVLYVGKARSLKKRVRSYFLAGTKLDRRKSSMVEHVKDFTFVITQNEVEALALEANFIKQYKPKYNVILRDDKNYPYLKVTVTEKWPKVEVARRFSHDGNVYVGPYVSSRSYREALDFIRKNFPIRTCRYNIETLDRPCVEYQILNCGGPCAGHMSREEYIQAVDDVVAFLKGQKRHLLDKLTDKMMKLSDNLMFEEAAVVRDRICAIENSWEMQKVVDSAFGDIDVIGCYPAEFDGILDEEAAFNVFFIRNGVLVGVKDFHLKDLKLSSFDELLHGFLQQFYNKDILPPEEIIVRKRPDKLDILKRWLKKRRSLDVKIHIPKGGKKDDILKMAEENARTAFELKARGKSAGIMEEIGKRMGLKKTPRNIGAFDISTISGADSVGAFICYEDGVFRKDLYRKVKIKTVAGVDDYSMMKEAVSRVLGNLGDSVPDILIIDGGKGQLEAALSVCKGADFKKKVFVAALAKRPERLFLPHANEPISLEDGSPSSFLLIRIRDEVHRTAVSYHRKLRQKRLVSSPLESIPGVSKTRRLALLKHFDSISAIKKATVDDISAIKGFNKKLATTILEALQKEE